MVPNRRAFLALLLIVASQALRVGAAAQRQAAPGVTLEQRVKATDAGPVVVHALRVDLREAGVRVVSALGRDVVLTNEPAKGRETVGDLAARRGAFAGINTDFFPYTGDPLGFAVVDGELVSEPNPRRAAMGIDSAGNVLLGRLTLRGSLSAEGAGTVLAGINRPTAPDELVLLTPTFGAEVGAGSRQLAIRLANVDLPVRIGKTVTAAVAAIEENGKALPIARDECWLVADGAAAAWARDKLRIGAPVSLRFEVAEAEGAPEAWSRVVQAVGGGPWLVRGGQLYIDGMSGGFNETAFVQARHPRTAVGVTAEGRLVLVVVDGRQPFSQGMSLPDLARTMLELGCDRAINLDGGGSSSLVVDGLYINGPSDGRPRPVSNALLVFAPSRPERSMETAAPLTLRAGETADIPKRLAGMTPLVEQGIWGSVEGLCYVSQAGLLTSTRTSTGFIEVRSAERILRIPYSIAPLDPVRIRATLQPNPGGATLTVSVVDRYGNGISGQRVAYTARGAEPTTDEGYTSADGSARFELRWVEGVEPSIQVRSGSLPPATVRPAAR